MKDLKIYYQCEPGGKQNDAFEVEILKLAEKFGLQFKRGHFDSVNRIRMSYFRK